MENADYSTRMIRVFSRFVAFPFVSRKLAVKVDGAFSCTDSGSKSRKRRDGSEGRRARVGV